MRRVLVVSSFFNKMDRNEEEEWNVVVFSVRSQLHL
jgi:hypothetical protein